MVGSDLLVHRFREKGRILSSASGNSNTSSDQLSVTGRIAVSDAQAGYWRNVVVHLQPWQDRLVLLLLLERTRWFVWVPAFLGLGIALNFTASYEPDVGALAMVALLFSCSLGAYLARFQQSEHLLGRLSCLCLALIAAGFVLASLRTTLIEAPVLARSGIYDVVGTVSLIEPRTRGARVTLTNLSLDDLPPDKLPAKIRLTVRNDASELRPGARLSMRARLQPPSGPLVPGGFDFAFQAYFKQLGGIGYAFGRADILERGQIDGVDRFFSTLRQIIAVRAEAANEGAAGPVSAALLTGLRANIPGEIWGAMQTSGLAHLLAISGLHMGLIAGTIYLAARYGLAINRWLTLRFPVKRLAAAIALLGAAFYLGLAGAPVPTQRAFLMTGTAFLAIMIDRSPISMRLVAAAAIVILVFRPDSLLGASFQMSFAAVIGLVAFYETVGRRMMVSSKQGPRGALSLIGLYFGGVVLTSLIATLATAPLAAFHFGKLPTYGIVANVIAVPLTAFWVMPLGLLGVATIPLGWDQFFFYLMGLGVQAILSMALWIDSLAGAVIYLPTLPASVLILGAVGGLWLCFWRENWRFFGLVPLSAAMLIAFMAKSPDILVAPKMSMVAYHVDQPDDQSPVLVQRFERDGFRERAFVAAMGVKEGDTLAIRRTASAPGLQCDHKGCVLQLGEHEVSVASSASAVFEDCLQSDLVIARNGPRDCPNGTAMIGFFDLRQSGGVAIYESKFGPEAVPVFDQGIDRPWTPASVRPR